MKPPIKKLGLRREANLFLPVSALILIVLSVVAMLSYRNALIVLTNQAQAEVLIQARQTASILPTGAATMGALREALGPIANGALVEADGTARIAVGDLPQGSLFAPLEIAPTESTVVGPDAQTLGRVIAFLPLRDGRVLRVDRPLPSLSSERQRWRRLMLVVTGAVGAIGTLLLLYLRRLFAPIDSLLRTARQLSGEQLGDDLAEGDDEIEYLVRRFESAMTALKEKGDGNQRPALGDQLTTLQQTFSRLESGMALIDTKCMVLALNEVGATMLAEPERSLPVPLAELLDRHPQLHTLLADSIEESLPLRRKECDISTEDGVRTLGLTLSPLHREDGELRGWILLFADLTDARQQAEQERLSTSLEQLAELSAGLAHELRNSLASMQGYVALLSRAELTTSASADIVELEREIGQLHRIVEDFLSFARPGSGQLEQVDLLRLAHRAAGDPILAGAAVRVRTAPEGDASEGVPRFSVQGDEQLLHRLLRNLLMNATRAQRDAQQDSPVTLLLSSTATSAKTTAITITVEDSGSGLSKAAERSLFVPFATDSEGGTGLGLAIARRIADLHGAELSVTNRKQAGARAVVRFRAQA